MPDTDRAIIIVTRHGRRRSYTMPSAFVDVIEWLCQERSYQVEKWGYGEDDVEHAREGLGEDSWFWQKAVVNYAGRVRQYGVTGEYAHQGVQALLKIVSSLSAQAEHLLRSGAVEKLPKGGVPSGEHS